MVFPLANHNKILQDASDSPNFEWDVYCVSTKTGGKIQSSMILFLVMDRYLNLEVSKKKCGKGVSCATICPGMSNKKACIGLYVAEDDNVSPTIDNLKSQNYGSSYCTSLCEFKSILVPKLCKKKLPILL